jgi:putative ABC transport system permease protein
MNTPGRRSLLLIVSKSLVQHKLSTAVTALSLALAAGLVMSVFSIRNETYDAFTGGPAGFDAVLGARGSQLQLVLNTVFHLETSPGNIPWEMYEAVKKDPNVVLAVPYAVGDNYRGFRIVGTDEQLFTDLEYRKGKKFEIRQGGKLFDPRKKEAVVGSFAARKTGLGVGSKFHPFHGLVFDERMRHEDEYTVVGGMEPPQKPSANVKRVHQEEIYTI